MRIAPGSGRSSAYRLAQAERREGGRAQRKVLSKATVKAEGEGRGKAKKSRAWKETGPGRRVAFGVGGGREEYQLDEEEEEKKKKG